MDYCNRKDAYADCITQGMDGGYVISVCTKAEWFHDPRDMRRCPWHDNKPSRDEVALRKNYRTKTVLIEKMGHSKAWFEIEQGYAYVNILLPKNQESLAHVIADYYYHEFVRHMRTEDGS